MVVERRGAKPAPVLMLANFPADQHRSAPGLSAERKLSRLGAALLAELAWIGRAACLAASGATVDDIIRVISTSAAGASTALVSGGCSDFLSFTIHSHTLV